MSEQNVVLSRRWFEEVWNERKTAAIDDLLTPESVGHMPGGDMVGIDHFKQFHGEFLSAFPDLRVDMEDIMADGDKTVVRWLLTGTHSGDGLGLEPTNRPVSIRGTSWLRFQGDKLMEGWDCWNQEGLFQQLREGSDDRREQDRGKRMELAERVGMLREDLYGPRGGPEMARRLDIPVRTYYNYEGGEPIPAEILLKIIEITGARPAWLLNGEEPRYENGNGPRREVG